jgi:hypothetical protein
MAGRAPAGPAEGGLKGRLPGAAGLGLAAAGCAAGRPVGGVGGGSSAGVQRGRGWGGRGCRGRTHSWCWCWCWCGGRRGSGGATACRGREAASLEPLPWQHHEAWQSSAGRLRSWASEASRSRHKGSATATMPRGAHRRPPELLPCRAPAVIQAGRVAPRPLPAPCGGADIGGRLPPAPLSAPISRPWLVGDGQGGAARRRAGPAASPRSPQSLAYPAIEGQRAAVLDQGGGAGDGVGPAPEPPCCVVRVWPPGIESRGLLCCCWATVQAGARLECVSRADARAVDANYKWEQNNDQGTNRSVGIEVWARTAANGHSDAPLRPGDPLAGRDRGVVICACARRAPRPPPSSAAAAAAADPEARLARTPA